MSSQLTTLGIDIGGTNTKLGIVDRNGVCLTSSSIPTQADGAFNDFLSRLFVEINQLKQNVGGEVNMQAVGIGAPNGNYYKGTIENAPNLHWGTVIPLAETIRTELNLPVWVTNDANAAAIGEMKFGAAKGMRNFVVITLGTGLGSGIVVNGDLVYGHDGFAGELGHVTVNPYGRLCGCGKRGCLETYVSATGIKRTVYKLLANMNTKSALSSVSFDDLNATMITETALNGDPVSREAFEYTGRILGQKLADTVAHLSPEAVILFGGLANAGKFIVEPTQRHMEENLMPIYKSKVKVLVSDLKGSNTAVLGASALAWQELDKEKALASEK